MAWWVVEVASPCRLIIIFAKSNSCPWDKHGVELVEIIFGASLVKGAQNLANHREMPLNATHNAVPLQLQLKDHVRKMAHATLAVLQHKGKSEAGQLAFLEKAASSIQFTCRMQSNIIQLIEAMQAIVEGPNLSWTFLRQRSDLAMLATVRRTVAEAIRDTN